MPTEKQALTALDEINEILRFRATMSGRQIALAGNSGTTDLAADYLKIRARLDTALTLIDRIPIYGREIGGAVRFLIQVCDRTCTTHPAATDGHESEAQQASEAAGSSNTASTPPLFNIGHTSFRAQPRRRESGATLRSSSADGSPLIGVI